MDIREECLRILTTLSDTRQIANEDIDTLVQGLLIRVKNSPHLNDMEKMARELAEAKTTIKYLIKNFQNGENP
jgi:hypothetical protein